MINLTGYKHGLVSLKVAISNQALRLNQFPFFAFYCLRKRTLYERMDNMPLALTLMAAATSLSAATCSPATYAALTAPKDVNEKPYALSCSVTLKKGDNIPRRIILRGSAASGVEIDCNGGDIGYDGIIAPQRGNDNKTGNPLYNPTILISSQKNGKLWSKPSDIHIRRCNVYGNIRTSSIDPSNLLAESRKKDFTKFLQKNSPNKITVSQSSIIGFRHIPLYIGAGTTFFKFENSSILGKGEAGIYLDFESGNNIISGNNFQIVTNREVIAVDGSANNVISNNVFKLYNFDGIHLYRNCGENGIIRHQPPSYNVIADNQFYSQKNNINFVIVNSRTGTTKTKNIRDPKICNLDKGYKFGSSISDEDEGRHNIIKNNKHLYNKLSNN
ncbi:hypothetical protein [Sphingobium yanoikuyae]|uniref:hypothetical protein n=1 Tax=Sphingobium yanoikuyae TaxID=13690 RepID=UPI0012DAB5D3|nr:hypothetical protein [Sphingobium yanoikuyae]